MKKLFILLVFIGSIFTGKAQQPLISRDLAEHTLTINKLLSRKAIIGPTFLNVSDYFTVEEQKILIEYLHPELAFQIKNQIIQKNMDKFSIYGSINQKLIKFNSNTPNDWIIVGDANYETSRNNGAINPLNSTLVYNLDSNGNLSTVDLNSGNFTYLGRTPPPNSQFWNAAAFDSNGNFYAISSDLTYPAHLAIIDLDEISYSIIGSMENIGPISLMIDDLGNAYTHDIVDDSFYSINLQTAATTIIGQLGFDANYGQGGTWIPGDYAHVFIASFNNDTFLSEWRKIDIQTGNSTLIGLFTIDSNLNQMNWVSTTCQIKGNLE